MADRGTRGDVATSGTPRETSTGTSSSLCIRGTRGEVATRRSDPDQHLLGARLGSCSVPATGDSGEASTPTRTSLRLALRRSAVIREELQTRRVARTTAQHRSPNQRYSVTRCQASRLTESGGGTSYARHLARTAHGRSAAILPTSAREGRRVVLPWITIRRSAGMQ